MSNEIIVFPTELALRRFQQEQALEQGWVETSGHTTFTRLRKRCLSYANIKGRTLGAADQLLMRRQVVEVAQGHFAGQGALGEVSAKALGDILEQLVTELASLPGETYRIIEWLMSHADDHKLCQLGTLISVWRATIKQEGFADAIDVNQAVLRLLRGDRSKWPPLLRDCSSVVFKSVRWFNPFEESCVGALNQKLKVRVESALPVAHAEVAADRLGQRIHSEIISSAWSVWTEDLGDALAVDSADVLQLNDSGRIDFSRSAGVYGEMEDLARRICWNIEKKRLPPNRIALIVPNVGTVQDVVPHVFSRFGIPYYFRRGRPVLSSPVVKTAMALLTFPMRPERDELIDLVRSPVLNVPEREAVVLQLQGLAPRIDLKEVDSFTFVEYGTGRDALQVVEQVVQEPEDHFNHEALAGLMAALEALGDHALPIAELIDLLERLLMNATVRPEVSHEQGVWVLNPHDAVGMEFDLVLFAGLNEGEFPGIPSQDALLSDAERNELRGHLEAQGRYLPKMALPVADVFFEQQSVLFLSSLGMAREQLLFSYQSVDQEGNEKGESEYFRKIWNLAGWPASEHMECSPYDRWRMGQLADDDIFSGHLSAQQALPAEDRVPMPGESFLPVVPLPLSRAGDEALQAAVRRGGSPGGGTRLLARAHSSSLSATDAENVSALRADKEDIVPPILNHLVSMLGIEAERDAFLDTPVPERDPSVYCGSIAALKEKASLWLESKEELSPTALETLAQNRYVFLIERVFGVRDPRLADDTPDPMDRGGLIHSILHKIYNAIALGESGIEVPRYWAVKADRGWIKRTEPGLDAIPLAVFLPELKGEYETFARKIAEQMMDAAELGHPGVWAAERGKMLEMVLNFVRYDVDTCVKENRFPALFELKFGRGSCVDLGCVKLHGIIDRVDLVFEETGALKTVRVLDYKGSSKSRGSVEEYMAEIIRNLDCQLPVYAFAAQQHFFDRFNTDELNAMTETGYLMYQRQLKDIGPSLKKCLIPMGTAGLVPGFLETLEANMACLKEGDFAVDPLIESYNDYNSLCRTVAVSLDDA